MTQPDFTRSPDGLLPAIVQDADTRVVLMLGYQNAEAWAETQRTGRVTFFSRSRQQLWTKGETSGHYLELVSASADCDSDTLLIQARPEGPTCHTGADTCWGEANRQGYGFLSVLEQLLAERHATRNDPTAAESYTRKLFKRGLSKQAQKVGEEAVELAIEAVQQEAGTGDPARLRSEAADLLFHYLVLLRGAGLGLDDVVAELQLRHRPSAPSKDQ